MKNSWKGHKDSNRQKNRIKRSGQARLIHVLDINHNTPTTWRWALGDALLVARVSTPTYDILKDRFSVRLSQHSCKLVSAGLDSCSKHELRLLCTLEIPCPLFDQRRLYGPWHRNTQITHNSSRIIKIMIVSTPNGRRKTKNHWLISLRGLTCPIFLHR